VDPRFPPSPTDFYIIWIRRTSRGDDKERFAFFFLIPSLCHIQKYLYQDRIIIRPYILTFSNALIGNPSLFSCSGRFSNRPYEFINLIFYLQQTL